MTSRRTSGFRLRQRAAPDSEDGLAGRGGCVVGGAAAPASRRFAYGRLLHDPRVGARRGDGGDGRRSATRVRAGPYAARVAAGHVRSPRRYAAGRGRCSPGRPAGRRRGERRPRCPAGGGDRPGLAWYGYVTAASLTPVRSPAVRTLSRADLPRLARLHEQTPPAERDEGGTTGLPAFGYFEGDDLLAVACLGVWHQMPTLGVLTHPGRRARAWPGRWSPRPPRRAWTAGPSSSTAPGGPTRPRSRWPGGPGSSTTVTA
jgi:hypothetical protein